ncbi:MAG: PA0069 family radical SAM protein [Bacteroidota bacterium]
MTDQQPFIKGRGAQINPTSRFDNLVYDENPVDWAVEEKAKIPTEYLEVYPKTILNKVVSPDIPGDYSMNPYQGCEHGCIYCYARNTHNYWGYSAGLEFESKILVKKNAATLLEKRLKHKNWKATPIMLSGNTDRYQPIEGKLEITRDILKTFWKYRHPVSIITKNSLILRDLDILKQLAAHNLVRVAISITTLQEELRRFLEPRTATIANRLKTVETLAANGIPTMVMMAPIIPSLNDNEILKLVKTVADLGASRIGYTMIRLNGDVATIFADWLYKTMPNRADRVLNQIRDCHGGALEDKRYSKRMSGEGNIANIIKEQFRIARQLYLKDRTPFAYNTELHDAFKSPQLRLF